MGHNSSNMMHIALFFPHILPEEFFLIDLIVLQKDYNCFDTGIFLCGTTLFKAIEESSINGDDSLSGGVRFLAKKGRAQAKAINGLFWCDIDDPKNFKQAEEYLSGLAENCN